MIWIYLILFFVKLVSWVFDLIHLGLVSTLPFGVDSILVSTVTRVNELAIYVPILGPILGSIRYFLIGITVYYFLKLVRIVK